MRQSLDGLLKRVADILERNGDPHGYSYSLRRLLANIAELQARKAEGEKVLDEFFRLYVVGEPEGATE